MNIIETNLSFGSLSRRGSTKRLILHHAEASSCDASTIHKWHKANGWAGIGYHFVVRKNGTIERGRPEWALGAHASGSNSDSIGICFEGSYMKETMPEAQKKSGKELVALLKNKYGSSKVQRHCDVCATSCPGTNFPFSEIAESKGSSTNNTGTSTKPSVNNCLGLGDRGDDVAELQRMLIACGYSCGKCGADGIFGADTESAVMKFQRDYKLVVDKLAGVNVMSKLRAVYASIKSSASNSRNWISGLQSECNRQGFSNQKIDGIAGKNTLAGCPTLKFGASGNITKIAQERLISLGFSCGSSGADGKFGNGTKNAVIAFQKAHGLAADGIIGQNTWRKLLGM